MLKHDYVFVERPKAPDGRRAVRGSNGMYWSRQNDLTDEICAICGYGPTEIQQEKLARDGRAPHTAMPVVTLLPE